MDCRYLTKHLVFMFCFCILDWKFTQCEQKIASSIPTARRPTKVNQITTPLLTKLHKIKFLAKKKPTGKSKGKIKKAKQTMKEFPLPHLLEIGITSNEANNFIKGNTLRGKPLELQYERTRENDMNRIEDRLMQEQAILKQLLKSPSHRLKDTTISNTKRIILKKKIKPQKWVRQLGFI